MRQRPRPEDDADRKLMSMIDEHGWAVRIVGDPDGKLPTFHYSAGMYERTGQPELLVIGLNHEVGHWVVNEYGRRCTLGEKFQAGQIYDEFLEGHRVTFVEVDWRAASNAYTSWTAWYYSPDGFPLLQLVWPDPKTSVFPWEPGFRDEIRDAQPVLGQLGGSA